MEFSFPKSERLRHKSLVDPLFREGKSVFEYPIRMVFRPLTEDELKESFRTVVPDGIAPLQVMITIPKKKIRHAVDRVLMRRRIREAWRLQRRPLRDLIEAHPRLRTLSVGLIYAADIPLDSHRIQSKLTKLITRLTETLPQK